MEQTVNVRWHWPLLRVAPVAIVSIAFAALGSIAFPSVVPADVPDVAFIEALVHWDAGWYGSIADGGYWLIPGQQSPVAFFPLYPLAIHALTLVGINRWVAGSLVSLLCALVALLLFSQWARLRDEKYAPTAFWLLTLYPFAEYLYGVVYSDALFLVLVVAAFLSLEKGKHGWAFFFGMLATACRPVAPAVVIGLLARSIEIRVKSGQKVRFVDLIPALSGIGLASYMAYLQWKFGDALAFAHVQSAPGWDHQPGWHSWLKLEWFRIMFPKVAPIIAVRLGGHAAVTIGALALVVPTFKRLGWGYGLYVLLVVGIPALSSHDFQGLGRYVMAAFPLFLVLAQLIGERVRMRRLVLVGFALLLAALSLAFGAGGYVA